MSDGAPRAQLKSVDLERLDGGECLVRVEMVHQLSSLLHQTYVGKARGECTTSDEMRCAAEATLQALERAYGATRGAFSLKGVKTVESFERLAVLVAVGTSHAGKAIRLVGFCEIVQHLRDAASKATCNALNRFLSMAYPSS
jgi:hypothetical protein